MKFVTARTALAVLLAAVLLPIAASAYTTPGTGINWTTEQLADSSAGAITFNGAESRFETNETLTIAAGDTVALTTSLLIDTTDADNKDIVVYGALYLGEVNIEVDSVYIIGEAITDTTDGPGGIKVEDTGSLFMVRTVLDGAGEDGQDDGIFISGGQAQIRNSLITGWMGYATRISSGGDAEIIDCLYKDNMEYTIGVNLTSSLSLQGSTLEGNNLSSPNSGKTAVNIGTQGSNSAVIDNCTITGTPDNRSGGISVWNFTGTSQTATITNTTVENCAFGINVQGAGAYAEITDCTLQNNTAYSNAAISGSGVSIYGGGEAYIAHNTITGNYWGITIPSGSEELPAVAHLGEAGSEDYKNQGFNLIYGNENNGVGYNIYNNTPLNHSAENNYWGSTDLAVIDSLIVDAKDNATLGEIDILPIWGNGEDVSSILASSSPDSDVVELSVDEVVEFSIVVFDPDDISTTYSYEWTASNQPGTSLGTNDTLEFSVGIEGPENVVLTATATGSNDDVVSRSWTLLVDGVSSVGEGLLPQSFALKTYPNPFNAETRVSYTLPSAAQVRISVYDVLGRQVRELAGGMKGAGLHYATFDASTLASGVYFLRFESEQWNQMRKITLVR